eukprot:TRINITY_DN645_c0_g2_i6.p1 TRINITY_DN645_c0_g2~~TRINITY_DN645_c0_g2_i6.p1  ORF type:complete len:136 (-),score=26.81 TRINITY_DN645_c0_g2_i6:38-445(-)
MAQPGTSLMRHGVWKVAAAYGVVFGFLTGTFRNINFYQSALPAFHALEEKKRDSIVQAQLAAKDRRIAELEAQLHLDQPEVVQVEKVDETVTRFHYRDLESDDLLDRWVSFINETSELTFGEETFVDTRFADTSK